MFFSCNIIISAADPEYFWKKPLKAEEKGLTARTVKLTCHLNMAGAKLKWLKNGIAVNVSSIC
jgi:hypothetical protein